MDRWNENILANASLSIVLISHDDDNDTDNADNTGNYDGRMVIMMLVI